MPEKTVDSLVQEKLKKIGYKAKEINYGYKLKSEGNMDIKPKNRLKYLSKNKKETRIEYEFFMFMGSKNNKIEKMIIIEDKENERDLGKIDDIGKDENLYKKAVTDVCFYAYDLLSKTDEIKSIFSIAIAGENLKATAIFWYKNTEYIDKYSKYEIHKYKDDICFIYIENWNDWEELSKDKFEDYVNSQILNLSSPDNELNISHIRTVAAKLSNTIDKKLKLDPFKRLLLVSGLLLGISYDNDVIKSFKKPDGVIDLYTRIKSFLKEKLSNEKIEELLKQYSFIKDDKKISTILINKKGEKEGYPLEIITKELLKKSPIGYSLIDLMNKSSHIDLLGNLFDIFTKYMNVGGASADIVLTPSHLTKFMSEIIDINSDDYVLDITVGTAGFLISAMTIMDECVDKDESLNLNEKIKIKKHIRMNQLWGVDYDNNMYAVAVTNMLLHGDGKSHIFHGNSDIQKDLTTGKDFKEIFVLEEKDTFNRGQTIIKKVEFTKLLFNPPYDKQALFVKNGLQNLKKGGLASIIIPKSTFNKGGEDVEKIFSKNRLLTVIDLPLGQFKTKSGNKGTDVAIFIFQAKIPHDFDNNYVNFIKVKKDEVKTKGNSKGIASIKTNKIFNSIVKFIKSDYRDLSLISNDEYFDKFIQKKLTKGKYMYIDYINRKNIKPEKKDFFDVFRSYFGYLNSLEVKNDGI